jgi:hypothetical protein
MRIDDLKESKGPPEEGDPARKMEAVFQAREPGYVPAGVELRSRIDDYLFTGSFEAQQLESLHNDKRIVSIETGTPIKPWSDE